MEAQYLILGGGLAGGLAALALCDAGRGGQVVLVERDARLGGNHTWSFHDTDLDAEQRRLVAPLVAHRWPRHVVRFPGRTRVIESGYATFTGDDLARVVTERLRASGGRVLVNASVATVEATAEATVEATAEATVEATAEAMMTGGTVLLTDGRVLRGHVILDARGAGPVAPDPGVAYQKFVGLELQLRTDGPWTMPVVMDATVPQVGGYHFIYVLPFTPRRVLVEDTIYSADPTLDIADAESRVWSYVQDSGTAIERILRREIGVLPLPLSPAVEAGNAAVVLIGYRGGFFHPVTGYSLPLAARVATVIARAQEPDTVAGAVAALARDLRGQRRFQRLLNRLLFQGMPPAARWHALDRFYRLPDATIARFYASRNTLWDRLRVLAGRPPRGVSLWRLLRMPPGEA